MLRHLHPAAVLSISGGISPALAGLCLVYALDMTVRPDSSMCSKQPGTRGGILLR